MQEDTKALLTQVTNGLVRVAGLVRQDTVDALKRGHIDAIKHYYDVRNATEAIKSAREAIAEIEDQLSKQQIPDIMRAAGVKSVKVEGIGNVIISHRYSASMLDKDAGFKWLRDNGHDGLITETVNSSSLSAFAKSLLEDDGVEMPPEIFKVGTQAYTSIRK